jgi:hypothetical protein
LEKLDQGQYPLSIAQDLNKSKQLINYYIRRLERQGYIERVVKSSICIYELLPKGKAVLERLVTPSQGAVLPRFHHLCLMFPVLGGFVGLERFLPLARGSQMRGAVEVHGKLEFDGDVFSVSRWHTPRSEQLKIWSPATYERSVGDALMLAGIKLDRAAQEIARRYDLVLGPYRKIQRPEFAYENDPYARYWSNISAGAVVKTDEGSIDESEGPPEVEFFTTEAAVAYLKMPQEMQRQRSEIQAIKETFKEIAKDYKDTTERFGREMSSHLALISAITKTTEKLGEAVDELRKQRQGGIIGRIQGLFKEKGE